MTHTISFLDDVDLDLLDVFATVDDLDQMYPPVPPPNHQFHHCDPDTSWVHRDVVLVRCHSNGESWVDVSAVVLRKNSLVEIQCTMPGIPTRIRVVYVFPTCGGLMLVPRFEPEHVPYAYHSVCFETELIATRTTVSDGVRLLHIPKCVFDQMMRTPVHTPASDM